MVCNKKKKTGFHKTEMESCRFFWANNFIVPPVEVSYCSWDLYTTGQLVDGLQQKKRKPVFIKQKWDHVVFSRPTILSFHPEEGSYRSWDLYTTGKLVDGLEQKKKTDFHLTETESCRLF